MASDATGARRVGAEGKGREGNPGEGPEPQNAGPVAATGGQACSQERVVTRTPRRRKSLGSRTEPAGASDARFWLITKRENGRTKTLTLYFEGGEEVLPVFSSEEEALVFSELEAPADAGWRAVGTTAPELVSALLSLSAERVALDPLPTGIGGEALVRLVSLDRGRFLTSLGSKLGLAPSSRLQFRKDDNRRHTDEKSAQQMDEGDREVAARSRYEGEGWFGPTLR